MGDAASDGSPLLGCGCRCDARVRASWGELRVIGRETWTPARKDALRSLLAWIVSLVDVNQILRPPGVELNDGLLACPGIVLDTFWGLGKSAGLERRPFAIVEL